MSGKDAIWVSIEKYAAWSVILILMATTVATAWWLVLQPSNYIRFYDADAHNYIVRAGDYITIERNYCSRKTVKLLVKRVIRDGITYQMEDDMKIVKKGCFNQQLKFMVPQTLPAGYYIYDTYAVYKLNPLRNEHVIMQPIQFVVLNDDGTKPEFGKLLKDRNYFDGRRENESGLVIKETPLTENQIANIRPTQAIPVNE